MAPKKKKTNAKTYNISEFITANQQNSCNLSDLNNNRKNKSSNSKWSKEDIPNYLEDRLCVCGNINCPYKDCDRFENVDDDDEQMERDHLEI